MESWLRISLILCVFGFLKGIRPSEPFVYDYLIDRKWHNFTDTQIVQEIYPLETYSNMILLILLFLIIDLCRYKIFIVLLGISGIIIWSLLLWSPGLFATQIVEVLYGLFMASEIAYYTYIYAKVDTIHYQKVTSHTRAAILAGHAFSGILSQLLISTNLMDFRQLNYITLASMTLATVWAFCLPSVKNTIYFHNPKATTENLTIFPKFRQAFHLMKTHFFNTYSNFHVLKWSFWWSLSTCGYVQVENYMQPLYATIQPETAFNGGVEAALTLLGFLAALLAGYSRLDWLKWGELILSVFSLIQGICVLCASQTHSIFFCYSLYVIFGILYQFMVTIASSQIAEHIDKDSYGFIFGINAFVALVFNSILTLLVATKGVGFHLRAKGQYVVYGGYHLGISFLFVLIIIVNCIVKRNKREGN